MKRVQTELNLGQPALTPTVQRAGQYRVAVTPTPKTNQALQLAQALRVTPQILGQADNIRTNNAIEAAAQVDSEKVLSELKNTDPQAFNLFQKQSAYREALLKRDANSSLIPAFNDALNNVSVDDTPEFNTFERDFVNSTIEAQRAAYIERLGASGDTLEAKALFEHVAEKFKNDATLKFQKEMEDGIKNETSYETGVLLESLTTRRVDETTGELVDLDLGGFSELIAQRDQALQGAGYSKSESRDLLVDSVSARIKALISEGRVRDAQRLYDTAKATTTNGAKLFSGTKADTAFAPLVKAIETAEKTADATASEKFADIAVDALAGLRGAESLDDVSPTQIKVMKRALALVNPQATSEDLTAMVEAVFDANADAPSAFSSMLREAAVGSSDDVADLYFGSRRTIDYALGNIVNRPLAPYNLTEERKAEELELFEQYASQNPTKDYRDFVKDTGRPYKKFNELVERSNELTAGNYILDNDVYKSVSSDLKSDVDNIEDTMGSSFSAVFVSEVEEDIKKQILDYARRVSKEDNAIELVAQKRAELFQDAKKYLSGVAKASAIEIAPLDAADIEDIEETDITGGSGRNKVKYKTINKNSNPSAEDIAAERATMLEKGHGPQLGLSLYLHGYSSYAPEAAKALDMAGLDAGDVRLFGSADEMTAKVSEFYSVLNAMDGLGSLDDAQQALLDEMNSFGIYDVATLEAFARAQASLQNL